MAQNCRAKGFTIDYDSYHLSPDTRVRCRVTSYMNHMGEIIIPDSQGGNFNTASFDILVKSLAFVDRTLLLERLICAEGSTHIITAPLGFGKSALLSMVKHFMEHYVERNISKDCTNNENPNLKLFTNLKISRNTRLMEKHFGRYPVINLDLTCHKEIRSYKDAIDMMRDIIHEAYKNHGYLLHNSRFSTQGYESSNFDAIVKKWVDEDKYNDIPEKDVLNDLTKLAEMLHIQHDQKCYILVDNYDSMVNSALGNIETSELCRISDMVFGTLGVLFKGTLRDQHLAGGIITGESFLPGFAISRDISNINPKCFPKVHEFSEFLGLDEKQVCTLFRIHDMEKFIYDALYHYNSHVGNNGVALYNPWSVFSCIHNKKQCFDINEISDYWKEKDVVKEIITMLKIYPLRNKIYTLLAGESITVTLLETLSTDNLEELNIFMSGNKDNLELSEPTVFSFLVRKGFLKIEKILNPRHNTYLVSMPNLESKNAFRNALASYFKLVSPKQLSICQKDLNQMLSQLKASKDTVRENVGRFLNSFNELLQDLFQRDPNFRQIHVQIALQIIFCLINYPPYLCPRVKGIDDEGRKAYTQPDIYVMCEDLGACIVGNLRFDVPLLEIIEQMNNEMHMAMVLQSGASSKNITHCLILGIMCTMEKAENKTRRFCLHSIFEVRELTKIYIY